MQYTIDEIKNGNFSDFHNLPYVDILNIDDLTMPNGVVFDNLPPTITEININTIWAIGAGGLIKDGMYAGSKSIKEFIKKIFPNRPFGCKIYIKDY